MGLRFRKFFKIAPGIRFNINKKSVGVSAGIPGARASINSDGRKTVTVGVPGTGLYYTESTKGAAPKAETPGTETARTPSDPQKTKKPIFKRVWFWIFVALAVFAVIGTLLSSNDATPLPPDPAINNASVDDLPAVADPIADSPTPTIDAPENSGSSVDPATTAVTASVWVSSSGSKYHAKQSCSSMQDPSEIALEDARNQGYTACKRCKPSQ